MTTYTPEQQAAHRKLWVEALRSGEYAQYHGALHSTAPYGDAYCCLGVACRVAMDHGVSVHVHVQHLAGLVEYNGDAGILPHEVADWLGIESLGEFAPIDGVPANTLAVLNDDLEWTFDQIADFIESEPRWVR